MRPLPVLLLPALLSLPCRAAGTAAFVSADADRVYTLDPAAIYDRQSLAVAVNIFEPLVIFGTDPVRAPFSPFLSAEVPTRANGLLSEDGKTYAFPIRPGVAFQDGTPLTPEDVRYSFLRFMLQDRDGGPAGLLLKPILGVYSTRDARGGTVVSYEDAAQAVRVDGGAVIVRLKEPCSAFLDVLASWPFVTSKGWAAAHGDWDGEAGTWKAFNGRDHREGPLRWSPMGTGPFRLSREETSEDQVVLVRHDGYWRGPAPLAKVVFHQVDSEFVRLGMLQAGDADSAALSRSSLRDLAGAPDIVIQDDLPTSSVGPILLFTFRADGRDNPALGSGRLDGKGMPPDLFSDEDVRRGFAHSFDYDLFLKQALRGKGERAEGPLPLAALGMTAGVPAYGHDPERAVRHLKKAWGGRLWEKGFQAELAYNANDPTAQALAEMLAAGLRGLNPAFALTPKPMWASTLEKESLRRRLPLFISGFEPDYPDAHSYAVSLLHSEGTFPKAQGFADPEADRLVASAMRNTDEAARAKDYAALQERYQKTLPQLYFFRPTAFRVMRGGVSVPKPDLNRPDPFALHNFFYFYRVKKNG
ncbi:MAG: hypothetical protein A2X36_07340 [Elusimicrobia bacterium GWA2_69_24]|nr:MAG: hypothetical protein A2X36_07340 [Elusimicrobia bacterium GWA2_69_24]